MIISTTIIQKTIYTNTHTHTHASVRMILLIIIIYFLSTTFIDSESDDAKVPMVIETDEITLGNDTDSRPSSVEPSTKSVRTGKQYKCPHCSYSADKKVRILFWGFVQRALPIFTVVRYNSLKREKSLNCISVSLSILNTHICNCFCHTCL